jgi:hypothetical protein
MATVRDEAYEAPPCSDAYFLGDAAYKKYASQQGEGLYLSSRPITSCHPKNDKQRKTEGIQYVSRVKSPTIVAAGKISLTAHAASSSVASSLFPT